MIDNPILQIDRKGVIGFWKYPLWMMFFQAKVSLDLFCTFILESLLKVFSSQSTLKLLSYFLSSNVSELCAEIRCAKKIGKKVIIMTNIATTFVTGLSRGPVNWLNIQMGSVVC